MFEPGDIVLRYRPKYKGPFKYLVTRCILFFTTEWWKGESTSKVYHAEMYYGDGKVITMEPPYCRLKDMRKTRFVVFRAKHESASFEHYFFVYCNLKMGQKYDFLKLIGCLLDWVFHTRWFTRHFVNPAKDICSEFVARFYKNVNWPCSEVSAESSTPDDILDFCETYSNFNRIYDTKG